MAAETVISFGPYQLLPSERLLLKGSEEIQVGSRALDVLIALVEAAGEVVGKRELIAKAWPKVAVGDSSLRVTVAELRKALGDGGSGVRYIANVTGRGYCFVAPICRSSAPSLVSSSRPRGFGRHPSLPDPKLWPFPVNGAGLLDEVAALLERHVALPKHAAVAIALWVVHTHAFEASPIAPRLGITGPAKRCGRNTLLRLIGALVRRPLSTTSITAPALFRTVEALRPTLLIDEAASLLKDNEDLRALINAGHARDGAVIRAVREDRDPWSFSCWAPAAIAAIGRLPDTVEDRSVMIATRRRSPGDVMERLRLDRLDRFETVTQRCARWSKDNLNGLADADPDIPLPLNNRAADNWRPLFAIADLAGGTWPDRARQASLALSDLHAQDETSAGTMILADIRTLFADRPIDRIRSVEIARYLAGLDHRPWPKWKNGRPITPRQVANLLAAYDISPHSVRIGAGTPKGYEMRDFTDAFSRHLSPDPRHAPNSDGRNGNGTEDCGGVADNFSVSGDVRRRTGNSGKHGGR